MRCSGESVASAAHALGDEVVPGYGAGRRVAVDDVDFARPVVDVLPRPQCGLAVLDVGSSLVEELEVVGYAAEGLGELPLTLDASRISGSSRGGDRDGASHQDHGEGQRASAVREETVGVGFDVQASLAHRSPAGV